jgi:murein DD-endopeptidase MepM/ murein hydrolase activator NlpD
MKILLVLSATTILCLSAGAFTTYNKKPVKPAAASLVYPVSGIQSKVGGYFGDYRNGGRSHKGVDIYAKKGTAVVAICAGIVTSTKTEKLGGKTIRLRSAGRSWTAYYAHLDRIHVSAGQYVQKGQAIGTVGNTGNAKRKAAHLHFGIIGHGRAVNPLPYVKKAKKISNPFMAVKTKRKGLPLAKHVNKTLPARSRKAAANTAGKPVR